MSASEGKKIIFYDGKCPMCTALTDTIEDSSQKNAFVLKDITKGDLPPGVSAAVAQKGIHVVNTDGTITKNADAVLAIAGAYPRLSLLARWGRLPVIRQVLETGYKLVAMHRHFLFGANARIFWTKAVIVLGFAAGFALSFHLWAGVRSYPFAPVIPGLPPISYPFDYICFVALFILLAWALFSPRPRVSIISFIVLLGTLCAFDQSRWQPWVYQYLFVLIALAFFSWKSDDAAGGRSALNIARLIVVATYFYSGLQKINLGFIAGIFPYMLGVAGRAVPALYAGGFVAPFIEIGVGLALLFGKRLRNAAVLTGAAMHVFIFASLGPFGLGINSVIWPWEFVMIALLFLLFWRTDVSWKEIVWKNPLPFQKLVLVLFAIMPAFSFFGLWDAYLSSALYSGNTMTATIAEADGTTISVYDWSMDAMNVPPYPAVRIFKNDAAAVCEEEDDSSAIALTIDEPAPFFGAGRTETYGCAEL